MKSLPQKKNQKVSQMALAGTGFELSIRELSSIKPHEKTIPENVAHMVRELQEDGVQKDPILVDRKTGTVLDGMHRLAAFYELGMERAVCCSLDYDSESVTVGRWARVFSHRGDDVGEVLKSLGFTRPKAMAESLKALENRSEGVVALVGGKALFQTARSNLQEGFRAIEEVDREALSRGWKRTFVPDDEIEKELRGENLVMLVQRFQKDDVVRAAASHMLFPCKTSMHVVDPRPVSVRFPIEELKRARSGQTPASLRGNSGKILPPGSMYEGRRYKERLLMLNTA
jgi:hypothetical protein